MVWNDALWFGLILLCGGAFYVAMHRVVANYKVSLIFMGVFVLVTSGMSLFVIGRPWNASLEQQASYLNEYMNQSQLTEIQPWIALGGMLYKLEKFQEAEQAYGRAMALIDPSTYHVELLTDYAKTKQAMGKPIQGTLKERIDSYASSKNVANVNFWLMYADLLAEEGKQNQACVKLKEFFNVYGLFSQYASTIVKKIGHLCDEPNSMSNGLRGVTLSTLDVVKFKSKSNLGQSDFLAKMAGKMLLKGKKNQEQYSIWRAIKVYVRVKDYDAALNALDILQQMRPPNDTVLLWSYVNLFAEDEIKAQKQHIQQVVALFKKT